MEPHIIATEDFPAHAAWITLLKHGEAVHITWGTASRNDTNWQTKRQKDKEAYDGYIKWILNHFLLNDLSALLQILSTNSWQIKVKQHPKNSRDFTRLWLDQRYISQRYHDQTHRSQQARCMSSSVDNHMKEVHRLYSYLKGGSMDLGLFFQAKSNENIQGYDQQRLGGKLSRHFAPHRRLDLYSRRKSWFLETPNDKSQLPCPAATRNLWLLVRQLKKAIWIRQSGSGISSYPIF